MEPTSLAYVDYVWSGHLKSRGLVSVSNEKVRWNSGTINIIDVWADIDVNHVEWHLTLASLKQSAEKRRDVVLPFP